MFSWDCHTTRSASMLYLHMWWLDLFFCQNCVIVIEKSVALWVWTSMPIISILFFEIFPYIYLYLILLQQSWQVFFPLHQKDLFIKSSPLPQFQWQQTIFHFPPSVGFVFVLNPAECATSVDLLPLVFHCFSKRIFSLWVEFYFLCCIIVQSWLIISSNAIFIIMKIFTVWILACVIPASYYFFDECLEEISVGLLWEKRK